MFVVFKTSVFHSQQQLKWEKKLLRGFYYTMIHITNNIACYIEICNPTNNMLILGTFM